MSQEQKKGYITKSHNLQQYIISTFRPKCTGMKNIQNNYILFVFTSSCICPSRVLCILEKKSNRKTTEHRPNIPYFVVQLFLVLVLFNCFLISSNCM